MKTKLLVLILLLLALANYKAQQINNISEGVVEYVVFFGTKNKKEIEKSIG